MARCWAAARRAAAKGSPPPSAAAVAHAPRLITVPHMLTVSAGMQRPGGTPARSGRAGKRSDGPQGRRSAQDDQRPQRASSR
eukprot:8399354-Pyramimonas_sp.AAC.1